MKAADTKAFKPSRQEIERFKRTKIDFSDIPEMTPEQLARMVSLREFRKRKPVSVRIDPRVIEWLKAEQRQ